MPHVAKMYNGISAITIFGTNLPKPNIKIMFDTHTPGHVK